MPNLLDRPSLSRMIHSSLELITVFVGDIAIPLLRATGTSQSYFGGVQKVLPASPSHGPKQLHQIGLIASLDLVAGKLAAPPFDIPLMYGLCYDDCFLRYSYKEEGVEITELLPSISSEDWPYPNYPDVLPRIPLVAGHVRSGGRRELAALVPDLLPPTPSEILVVVPPPSSIGYSLWGAEGDAENVKLIFQCSWLKKSVLAYNVCG